MFELKTAFTRQTKVGKLVLANLSWCVWTAQKQANKLVNCWRQIELASILANFFTNFFVLVNSYLTCERLANVCWWLSTNQNTRSIHVICVTLHKMADRCEDERATFRFIEEVKNCPDLWDENGRTSGETGVKRRQALGRACCTLQGWDFYWYKVSSKPSILPALSVSSLAINTQ